MATTGTLASALITNEIRAAAGLVSSRSSMDATATIVALSVACGGVRWACAKRLFHCNVRRIEGLRKGTRSQSLYKFFTV